jgi:hypothetical protein
MSRWHCLVASVLVFRFIANSAFAAEPSRHLFLDPAFVRNAHGTALRVNRPQQRQLVIRPDRPWEKLMITFFLTVLDEPSSKGGSKLRMWYVCRDADNQPNVAYAESDDGLEWRKPNLGIVDYHGSTDNNLVGIPYLEGVVFRDPNGSGDQKYIYVTNGKDEGVVRYYSPDGLHWKHDAEPLLKFRPDTQNVTYWDERLGKYVLFLRAWDISDVWEDRLRTVARLEVSDLTKPTGIKPSARGTNPRGRQDLPRLAHEVPIVFRCDDRDPPNCDVYNMSCVQYPLDRRWLVGFPSFLQREKNISDGRVETQFAASSDSGITWHRYDRAVYVGPQLIDTESANMSYMGTGMAVRGDELWQWGTEYRTRHGDSASRKVKTDGSIYRYVQRVDGFISLDFDALDARCTTNAVSVDGDRLLLNVDTSALGTLRVGLLDESSKPLDGYELENCNPVRTNSTGAIVTWKDKKDLASLAGRKVKLALSGTRAKLYSFRFEQSSKSGAKN